MNSEELRNRWSLVCERIQENDAINPSQMNAFFSRLQPQAMSDGFLMLTADNDFIKSWIEKHYSEHIKQALEDLYGIEFVVALEVDPNQEVPADAHAKTPAQAGTGDGVQQEATQEIAVAQVDVSQQEFDTPEAEPAFAEAQGATDAGDYPDSSKPVKTNDDQEMGIPTSSLTFENFVIGESNRMAYSMAVSVAEEPGRGILNPLFIYGKSGLGKTHLMRAIQNYINETQSYLKTVYVDSADFLSGFVEASVAHDKEKTSFRNFKSQYQEADVLLIDDIQYLQGKEQTLDIVFQIFNHLVDQGKQVVLSADRAPKNITMDERYQSRFNSGGTFDIQPPEVETKLGIIKSFVAEYQKTSNQPGVVLSDEIARYIAENSGSNIRELKSAVTKVIYAMNAFGEEKISVDSVSRLLENHFSGGAMKKLSIADIQKQVEQYYDVSHAEIISAKRSRKIVYARQVAIYLCREMLDMPYNYIAKSFGGRDHTTIMYSVTNIENKMKVNRELREELENIKRRIKEM